MPFFYNIKALVVRVISLVVNFLTTTVHATIKRKVNIHNYILFKIVRQGHNFIKTTDPQINIKD